MPEHFNILPEIYGGSPAVQSLNLGVDTHIVDSGGENSQHVWVESDQNTAIDASNNDVEVENVSELKSSRLVCDKQCKCMWKAV